MDKDKTPRQVLHNDEAYTNWLNELKSRYLTQRLKAMSVVNNSVLEFYCNLGRDIVSRQYANTYGSSFFKTLSDDLKRKLPDAKGFSPTNLKYIVYFYNLYSPMIGNRPQAVDDLEEKKSSTHCRRF